MGKQSRSDTNSLPAGLSILYQDRDIVVVDKPPGLLTMGIERDRLRTAYFILTNYVRKGNPRSRERIFIVHRLDRETSGVLVFARSELAKERLQGQWDQVDKQYLAVVHGRCEKTVDTITTYLTENKAHVVYSTTDRTKGRLSHTAYRVLKQAKNFALLEVDLLTGRKNQIRVHLAGIGHSIVGDRKYGDAKQAYNRLALHARSISLPHPTTGQQLCFTAPVPGFFHKLVGAFRLDDGLGTGQQ
jgi:tRNA pseudouridine32 synthase/23S rRNA pseudouridine746 synthase/23S rRNA pseudouridine1911/1915/1917 synthase